MICPKCQGKLKIVDTRTTADTTIRKKTCLSCGYQFRTTETIKEDIPNEFDFERIPEERLSNPYREY